MSWVSTAMYYDQINRIVQKRAAPMASAPLLIESLDFCQLYALREERDWQRAASVLIESAKRLEGAGAEALIIGANSMHRLYDDVAASVNIPILHIAEICRARAQTRRPHQCRAAGYAQRDDRKFLPQAAGRPRD
jgi:aspartate racemase